MTEYELELISSDPIAKVLREEFGLDPDAAIAVGEPKSVAAIIGGFIADMLVNLVGGAKRGLNA